MIQVKAIYYRYRNQIWFSLCLVLCGIGLLIWWQMAQSTTTESNNIATITANQKDDMQHRTANEHTTIKKTTQRVVIDIKGGVHRPGVYYFTHAPIVADALSKAGGMLPTVNSMRINLAAVLTNGQVLYIPIGDEQQPVEYPLPGNNVQPKEQVSTVANIDGNEGKLNLNTADITDLQNLPGIGEKRAQDIINEREKVGGFKHVTDLQEVSGIGEKTFAKLEPLVTV